MYLTLRAGYRPDAAQEDFPNSCSTDSYLPDMRHHLTLRSACVHFAKPRVWRISRGFACATIRAELPRASGGGSTRSGAAPDKIAAAPPAAELPIASSKFRLTLVGFVRRPCSGLLGLAHATHDSLAHPVEPLLVPG